MSRRLPPAVPALLLPLLLVLLLPLLLACSDQPMTADPAASSGARTTGSDDHGAVADAAELDEPALGLTTVDDAGVVRHLDLLDESVTELADLEDPEDPAALGAAAVRTDGRHVLVATDAGVEVVDTGVWTWDHVDHFHYYRAEPRALGLVEGGGPVRLATTASSVSGGVGLLRTEAGEAVLLDTEALAEGELSERFRVDVEPHDGLLVPAADQALLTEPGPDGAPVRVVVLGADGERLRGSSYRCVDAAGTISTRVGTVVGCADGALLATPDDEGLAVTAIPYPAGTTAPPATSFAGRAGRPTVAALAGPDRIWLLDTREESWRLLDSPVPLVQVAAVDDDDEHVLGLTRRGRMVVLDGRSGRLLATSRPLVRRSLRAGVEVPPMVVDQLRAYVAAPVERRLLEIDFGDDARVARTFRTPTEPLHLAGTGR